LRLTLIASINAAMKILKGRPAKTLQACLIFFKYKTSGH